MIKNKPCILLWAISLFISPLMQAMSPESKLAFLMGTHPRVGAESQIPKLPLILIQMIFQMADPQKIKLENHIEYDLLVTIKNGKTTDSPIINQGTITGASGWEYITPGHLSHQQKPLTPLQSVNLELEHFYRIGIKDNDEKQRHRGGFILRPAQIPNLEAISFREWRQCTPPSRTYYLKGTEVTLTYNDGMEGKLAVPFPRAYFE